MMKIKRSDIVMISCVSLLVVAVAGAVVLRAYQASKERGLDFESLQQTAVLPSTTASMSEPSELLEADTLSFESSSLKGISRQADFQVTMDLSKITGLHSGMNLADVTIVEHDEVLEVPFEEVLEYTEALAHGTEQITQFGQAGELLTRFRMIYHDGSLHSKERVAQSLLQLPVEQIRQVGTYVAPVETLPSTIQETLAEAIIETTVLPSTVEETLAQVQLQATEPSAVPYLAPAAAQGVYAPPAAPRADAMGFMTPGSIKAAKKNFAIIQGFLQRNGTATYHQFQDNGNGTITVDGRTFPVSQRHRWKTTCYDGYECAKISNFAYGECNPTATGILAQRGTVASHFGGLPFGTVVFVKDYGLAVVADRHGMGPGLMDLSMDCKEISQGIILETGQRDIYIIATP